MFCKCKGDFLAINETSCLHTLLIAFAYHCQCFDWHISVNVIRCIFKYPNNSKYCDRQAFANNVDPDQMPKNVASDRVYAVCHTYTNILDTSRGSRMGCYPTYWWEIIKHFWLSNTFSPMTKASQIELFVRELLPRLIFWTISHSRELQHYTFSLWQKPARLNCLLENYHPCSYFGLCPGYLATVPLKYELGNKTTISYLSGQQSKLSAPQCCGPPDELSPEAKVADSFDCRPGPSCSKRR